MCFVCVFTFVCLQLHRVVLTFELSQNGFREKLFFLFTFFRAFADATKGLVNVGHIRGLRECLEEFLVNEKNSCPTGVSLEKWNFDAKLDLFTLCSR